MNTWVWGASLFFNLVAGTDGEQRPLPAEAGAEKARGCSSEVNTRKTS